MGFFKEQTDTARATLSAMPMQSRITIGLLVIGIGVAFAFLFRPVAGADTEAMFGGRSFTENELASMEMALSRAGLSKWTREGTRIRIPSESKAEYLAALESASSLPLSIRSSVEEAIEKSSVFDSADMRHARQQYARERDLARAIMRFPDIMEAHVAYDRGERSGLSRTQPQSASVMVQPVGNAPLPRRRLEMIANLVRAAFSGMSIDDVVVTDLNGSSTSMLDDDDPMLRKQREAEALLEQKLRSLLVGYPARIGVSAEIDPTMNAHTTTLKYDAEPTTIASDTRSTESKTQRQPVGGTPGAVPNAIGNRSASVSNNAESTEESQDERQTRSVAGQTYQNTTLASLQVQSVSVTVGLPQSYYQRIHRENRLRSDPQLTEADVPPMSPAELDQLRTETRKNIQLAVAPLLPPTTAGGDPTDSVQVWDYPDPPEMPAQTVDRTAQVMTWLSESWQSLGLFAMGLIALIVARSAARAGTSPPAEFNEGFGLDLPAPPSEEEAAASEENMTITGESLQDELATIVESNPEVAANVIRGWVGEAA